MMLHPTIQFWIRSLITLAIAFCAGAALADGRSLAIFGDSLSDTGNKFAVTGMLTTRPFDTLDENGIPTYPYALSLGRFSNGRVWVEHVADGLNARRSARPALRDRRSGNNYAYGGARAFPDNDNFHLPDQVAEYLTDVGWHVDPETLHVIFIGGNDIVAALEALGPDPIAPDIPAAINRVGLAGGAIAQAVDALAQAGARRFLIMNVPNVGLVPGLPDGARDVATCFAVLLNQGAVPPQCGPIPPIPYSIAGVVGGLTANPEIEVTAIDVFTFISGVAAYPEMIGLSNSTDMCLSANEWPYLCRWPRDYLFWDGIHPTRKVHRNMGNLVLAELTE